MSGCQQWAATSLLLCRQLEQPSPLGFDGPRPPVRGLTELKPLRIEEHHRWNRQLDPTAPSVGSSRTPLCASPHRPSPVLDVQNPGDSPSSELPVHFLRALCRGHPHNLSERREKEREREREREKNRRPMPTRGGHTEPASRIDDIHAGRSMVSGRHLVCALSSRTHPSLVESRSCRTGRIQ